MANSSLATSTATSLPKALAWAAYLTSADFAGGVPGAAAEGRLDALVDTVARLAARLGGAAPLGPAPLTARPA